MIRRAAEEREQAVRALRTRDTPKTLEDVYAIFQLARQVGRRVKGPDGSDLNSAPTQQETAAAQRQLDAAYDWLRTTLEDSKLAQHFRYNHDLNYPSAQLAAMRILDAARMLRSPPLGPLLLPERVWDDQVRQIERDDRCIRWLLGESARQPTTRDRVTEAIVIGALAIPIAAAAVVTIPELMATIGVASLTAAAAVPGGATAVAFLVENYVVAEIVAAFAIGTVVTIADSGGLEGFGQQMSTPQGAAQTGLEVIIMVIQCRGPRGGGHVRVRGTVTERKNERVRIRVESAEPFEPADPAPAKLGKLNLADMRRALPGRAVKIKSNGVPPEGLKQMCASSIRDARQTFGERLDCDGHQAHHIKSLPPTAKAEPHPSPIGGAHEIVHVTYDGKIYVIDSSAKQFVREPNHRQGLVDLQKIRELDAKRPQLRLEEALNSGVFSMEQHDEFARLCGSHGL